MGPINYLISGDIYGFLLQVLFLLPAFVIALSFHEAAHAWMANKMGDPTAKSLGRLTIDPTKHFDLFGIITFIFIGFGWGKPVPTNPRNYRNYKKANILVAISGVSMNMAIALIALVLISILTLGNVFISIWPIYMYRSFIPNMHLSFTDIIHTILFFIAYINLILCFFNLIPIPPLDGHHLVKGYIARKSPNFYMAYQRYGFLVLILLLFVTPWVRTGLGWLVSFIIDGIGSLFGAPLNPFF